MSSTVVGRRIEASPEAVYAALLDPDALARWRFPDGMSAVVHEFEPWVGGSFRVSLVYDAPDAEGKSGRRTDTYRGEFTLLDPDREVVEALEFETDDPTMQGKMTIGTTLADADGGTEVTIRHGGVPPGVSATDNELGTRMALDNLAALLEP